MKKIFLLIFLTFIAKVAFSASFDCGLAKSNIEKMICQNDNISKLDEILADNYRNLLKIYSNSNAIKEWQKKWLRTRNACKDATCVEKSYSERISALKSAIAADAGDRKWTGYYFRYRDNKKDSSTSILLIAMEKSNILIDASSVLVLNASSGDVRTGEMEGVYKPKGSVLIVRDPDADSLSCFSVLSLKSNKSLLVEDESSCGGVGVSFNGEYRQ